MEVLFLIFIVAMVKAGQRKEEPGLVEKLFSPCIGAVFAADSARRASEARKQQFALEELLNKGASK